jgi:hypothetical protein
MCESGRLDRPRLIRALDELAGADDDGVDAMLLRLGNSTLAGVFGAGRPADVLERCVTLLDRPAGRAALPFLRGAVTTYLPSARGDRACVLRGQALVALHRLEPHEACFEAVRLLAEADRAPSGEPVRSALAVLGSLGDNSALVLACETVIADDISLVITALQQMTAEVPPETFWRIAAPLVGDRFGDAVLAITDLITQGRRADLLPGMASALPEVSDPDLMRAVLLSLATAHLESVETVFSDAVARAPHRALEAVEEALQVARIQGRDELLTRLQSRFRSAKGVIRSPMAHSENSPPRGHSPDQPPA